jgi:dienelactone hydrolase
VGWPSARLVTAAGRAFLLPDSFASRGQGEQCTVRARGILPRRERHADTLAAARWLSAQPFGLGEPVSVLGWSHGGSTALWAAGGVGDAPIARFVAFYPGCATLNRIALWRPERPVLLLIGEADDWTPAAPCEQLAARHPAGVAFHAYPGAYHGFDAPNAPLRSRSGLAFTAHGDGVAHYGSDPAARADALVRVGAFLQLER